jgi:hypothetical protein
MRGRGQLQELLQELRHAEVVHGRSEEHGRLFAPQEGLAVEGGQHVVHEVHVVLQLLQLRGGEQGGDLGIVQAPLPGHAGLASRLGPLEDLDLPRGPHVDTLEVRAGPDGPGHGHGVESEELLHLVDEFDGLPAGAVELVHEGEDRELALAGHAEQLLGLLFHALGAVQQHHHGIGRREGPVGVLAEVLVARGVQEVDGPAQVLELHGRGGDADAALLLDAHPVGMGRGPALPGLHAARPVDGAAIEQQLFRQRGLARVRVADDGEGSPPLDFFGEGHGVPDIRKARQGPRLSILIRSYLSPKGANAPFGAYLVIPTWDSIQASSKALSLRASYRPEAPP